jgi:hypothetical protein
LLLEIHSEGLLGNLSTLGTVQSDILQTKSTNKKQEQGEKLILIGHRVLRVVYWKLEAD